MGPAYLVRMSTTPPPADVLVIGIGGIGHAFLLALQNDQPDHFTLVDGDTVTAHNLGRQPLFSRTDLGALKVDAAQAALARTMPTVRIDTRPIFADRHNLPSLLNNASLVIDCTDDAHVKNVIDQACRESGTPLISAAVHAEQAQVILLHAAAAMGDPAITRDRLFSGKLGAGQDDCDMRHVPLEALIATGHRMAEMWDELRNGGDVMNGRVEMLHEGSWMRIAPPMPPTNEWIRSF